jgi:type IX secretion system PorP/SprF family membrane protein
MRIKITYILALCLMSTVGFSQQDPLYSQYMFNMMGINPAYAGSRDILSVTAVARMQWVGLKGAPTSQLLTGDFAMKNKKIGLGMQIYNDKIGVMKTTGFNFNYAYRISMKTGILALGLQGGLSSFRANYRDIDLGTNTGNDIAFSENVNEIKPTIGAGVFFSTDHYYIGFSCPHLLNQKHSYNTNTGSGKSSTYQNNHWIFTAGYVFNLTHDVALKPSLLLRMVPGAPLTTDINANVWFYKILSLGVSVRTSEMVIGMIEFQANKQFRFGYAYDYTTSNRTSRGSHELMLRYEFGFEKKRMVSPRYF